jgi:type II secretory pathway component PulM
MKEWWYRLNAREQSLVFLGSIFLAAILLYSLIWSPWVNSLDALDKTVAEQRELLHWMEPVVTHIQQLRGKEPVTKKSKSSTRDVTSEVERSLKSSPLAFSIKEFQPTRDGKIRILLDAVNFDQLMTWLSALTQQTFVHVEQLNVRREVPAGQVSVVLVLQP